MNSIITENKKNKNTTKQTKNIKQVINLTGNLQDLQTQRENLRPQMRI